MAKNYSAECEHDRPPFLFAEVEFDNLLKLTLKNDTRLDGALLYASGSRTMPIFRNCSCLCGNESTTECYALLLQLFVFGLFEFTHQVKYSNQHGA
jgi:hypothetical protein